MKQDLTGKRFSRYLVIKETQSTSYGSRRWLCKCDCGNEREVLQSNLIRGTSTSCGCFRREELIKPRAKLDLIGERFGRYIVTGYDRLYKGHNYWFCTCDCGTKSSITGDSLRHGKTLSCGCLQIEKATTHGMRYTPEYGTWGRIKHRCFVENHPDYKDYGGRGITVCDEWKDSFEAFFEHVGLKPFPKAQLDRIDNNGNYEPGNVRWTTSKINNNNRRTSAKYKSLTSDTSN
jgi:hypothetical protein